MRSMRLRPSRLWPWHRADSLRRRAPRRILLLLLLPIGDTLFATPTVRALRRAYPGAHLVALAYRTNAPILQCNPDIDRLLLHPTGQDWAGWPAYARLLWSLRRCRFDLVVQFGPAQWWLTEIIHPRRCRRMPFPWWRWFVPGGYRPWRWRHATASYATLLRPAERRGRPPLPLVSSCTADRAVAVAMLGGFGPGPFIALHPGGEGFRGMKRWPLSRFMAVAQALRARFGAQLLVLGGMEETDLGQALQDAVPDARVLAGLLTLGQTAALLEYCMLFVGNDSAPMHMAAALGVPTVGIFGPTDPRNFQPIGPRVRVVSADLWCRPCFHFVGSHSLWEGSTCRTPSCLHAVSTEAVLKAVDDVLSLQ